MGVKFDGERIGNNGQVKIVVSNGKTPVYADTLDPGVADERQRFLAKLMERCPDLVAEEVEEAILRLGAGGFPEARPQRPERPRRDPPPPWQPFPVDAFPEPVRGYIRAGAVAMKVDPAFLALPMLAGLASAVGATRQVKLKSSTWREPCVVWSAVVGESGTLKSPAQAFALRPLRRAQEWHLEQIPQLEADFLRDKQLFEADYQEWKKKGRSEGEPPPEKPEEPQVDRFIVSDVTYRGPG